MTIDMKIVGLDSASLAPLSNVSPRHAVKLLEKALLIWLTRAIDTFEETASALQAAQTFANAYNEDHFSGALSQMTINGRAAWALDVEMRGSNHVGPDHRAITVEPIWLTFG